MTRLTRFAGYVTGGLAVGVFALAAVPFVALWLLAAFLLDVADGGLLA